MATVSLKAMEVRGNIAISSMSMYADTQLKNKSAEVFKRGELVKVDATPEILRLGQVVGAGNDKLDVSVISAASLSTRILGVALKDAPASGQIVIPVAWIMPGTIIEANLVEGTDGDAPTNHTAVAGDLFKEVAILFDDTNDRFYFTTSAAEEAATTIVIPGTAGDATSGGGIGDTNIRIQAIVHSNLLAIGSMQA